MYTQYAVIGDPLEAAWFHETIMFGSDRVVWMIVGGNGLEAHNATYSTE